MLHKTRGIVLHHIKYGETSIIAHIYTELFGRQSYIINKVRSRRPLFSLNCFQPLTILDIESYYRPGKELQRIKEIKRQLPLDQIYSDIFKSSMVIFIAEIIYKTLHEAESNPSMFSFLYHSIQFLELMKKGIVNYHLVFLVQYSKHIGIFPQIPLNQLNEELANQKLAEQLMEDTPITSLSAAARKTLSELTRRSFQNLENINIASNVRIELLEGLVDFYKLHFDNIGQINSLKVLKEVFH
jgi:DNA repair protein RecO (recombination protein O)